MKEVKLIIDGLELVFGLGDNLPCLNCRIYPTRPRCNEMPSQKSEAIYSLCLRLGESYRVISCNAVTKTAHAPTATLNYPCGSMGEEIEQ